MHYVDNTRPDYTRRWLCDRFIYFDTHGGHIRDPVVIAHINKLAIPPVYIDVQTCLHTGGHLRTTGRNAHGHKQYRCHADWRAPRDANKYRRLLAFRTVLLWMCGAITAHLETPGLSCEKMPVTMAYLLDTTLVCVGNTMYARDNRLYRLATLRNQHVEVHGSTVYFQFRDKGGVEYGVSVLDPRLACIIRCCVDLPRQELSQYIDEAGERRAIDSTDMNAYLQEISGANSTARNYRIQVDSVLTLDLLCGRMLANVTEAHRQVMEVAIAVVQHLGNIPTVCRKRYVHPTAVDAFLEGELEASPPTRICKGLRREEVTLLRLSERVAGTRNTGEKKPA